MKISVNGKKSENFNVVPLNHKERGNNGPSDSDRRSADSQGSLRGVDDLGGEKKVKPHLRKEGYWREPTDW